MMNNQKSQQLVLYGWIIAATASLGSLFFSNVMGFVPCTLCWYQRICMYPLILILGAALIRFDQNLLYYSLPLTGTGWLISFYHNLVQWKIVPEKMSPCVQGIPCSAKYIEWGGFITIPLLSLTAFSILLLIAFLFKRSLHNG